MSEYQLKIGVALQQGQFVRKLGLTIIHMV